jgi:hypothetical protein
MSSTQNYVSKEQLLSTSYAMIALTSIVALSRVGIQVFRARKMMLEDYLIFFAYILFITMTAMYIAVTPALYRISDVTSGKAPFYPKLLDDSLFLIKVFFANTMIFWFVLWTVKFSLLALYRRLTIGLNKTYMMVWWGIVSFCVIVSFLLFARCNRCDAGMKSLC